MTHHNEIKTHNTEKQKRVFVKHAQVFSEEKRHTLSAKEKAYEKTCGEKGVWLELFCPDDACFTEEERVRIPVFCEDPQAKKSLWLDLFCPDDSCAVAESTKLS